MRVILRRPKDHWGSALWIAQKVLFWKKPNDPTVRRIAKFLEKALDWVSFKDKVQIDYWDSWNACDSLGVIILPILRQVKAEKGIPFVHNEDVPEELRNDPEEHCQKKWDYVISEMIFAFESLTNNWEEQFYSGKPEIIWEPIVPTDQELLDEAGLGQLLELKRGPNDTFKVDWDGYKAYENRVRSGFTLFGRYYQSLWT
jgi:hypothetical protein